MRIERLNPLTYAGLSLPFYPVSLPLSSTPESTVIWPCFWASKVPADKKLAYSESPVKPSDAYAPIFNERERSRGLHLKLTSSQTSRSSPPSPQALSFPFALSFHRLVLEAVNERTDLEKYQPPSPEHHPGSRICRCRDDG